jgi:hypothetical protein
MVDCKWSTTTIIGIRGREDGPTDSQLAAACIYRHETECGRCRTDKLWQRHTQPGTQAQFKDALAEAQRAAMAERKN